ncbi:MAG: SH3 domain-containing protein [Spirochaetales bacterium]|nr:SH3 domain-containing protein [Spirochaetales bacterium]
MKVRLTVFLLWAGSLLFAQTSGSDLLQRAEEAFREGRYGESANLYQEAAVRGNVNSGVYYNQGNGWFMAGEIHLAHLSYLKAENLSPGDGDIKRNLSFIRALSGEETKVSGGGELLHVLFFWHYDLSLRFRLVLFALFNGLFWMTLIFLILVRKGKGVLSFWPLLPLAFFAVSFFTSLLVSRHELIHHPVGVTLADTTARKGDGESFEEAFNRPLVGGTEFRLLDSRAGWYRIELADGSEGWIKRDDAGLVSFP